MTLPIYLYWGNDKLSFLRFLTIHTLCKFNERVVLIKRRRRNYVHDNLEWTEIKQDFQSFEGMDYSSYINYPNLTIEYLEEDYPEIALRNLSDVHISDLLGWYILATKGGTISDMDILYIKPVPEIVADIQLVSFSDHPKRDYIPVSFMQGRPNQFYKEVFIRAVQNAQLSVYESCGTKSIGGNFVDFQYNKLRLPDHIVFPFAGKPWLDYSRMMFQETHSLPESTIGIHWYAGANQKYNQSINHLNFKDTPCTITKYIGEVYEGINI